MNRVLIFVLATVVILGVFAAPPAQAGGSAVCVTARVETPFHLPDGQLYPASTLTLCDGGAYSPVDNFHRILVGGSTIGLFVSARRTAELRSAEDPQILFHRDADGNLSLIGYTLPSMGRSVAFRMKQGQNIARAGTREAPGGAGAPVATIVATAGTR
jgi:hypothetical protein